MSRHNDQITARLKAQARADAKAMDIPYATRLDAEAATLGHRDWSALQARIRLGYDIDTDVMMVAAMGGGGAYHVDAAAHGGGAYHVDAAFAMDVKAGVHGEDLGDAYRRMVADGMDAAALGEALARPAAPDHAADYRLRRDVARRSFWRGGPGGDRMVQAAAELMAALAHLAARTDLHAEMVELGVLPPLWRDRPLHPAMLRDIVFEATAYVDAVDEDDEPEAEREHAADWWRGVASLVERHLPTGVSGYLRAALDGDGDGGAACGCNHDHGHDHGDHHHHAHAHPHHHHEDMADRRRRAIEAMIRERADIVADGAAPAPPPGADAAAHARRGFEDAIRVQLANRLGGSPGGRTAEAAAIVDEFLATNDFTFGQPDFMWSRSIARRLANIRIGQGKTAGEPDR